LLIIFTYLRACAGQRARWRREKCGGSAGRIPIFFVRPWM